MCLHCFHLVASFLINFVFIVVAFIEISKLKSKETISSSSLQHLITELNNYLRLNQDYTQKLKENITLLSQDISALNNMQSQFLTAPSCAAILLVNPSSTSDYTTGSYLLITLLYVCTVT